MSNTLSTGAPSESAGDDDDTINVVVRVRPLNQQEEVRGDNNIVQFPGDGAVWIDTGVTTKSFTFHVTFEPEASQEDVFEHSGIKKLIEMALNGYSCTAFAFGQTGSGKTHTITGPPEVFAAEEGTSDPSLHGLIPRSFHYLFRLMNQQTNAGYRITASYLEIYNEQVIDLINPGQKNPLVVRWSKNKGFYVENLFIIECETIDDLMAVLEEGLRNRQTGSNSMNEHSSRSHSMLTLHIDSEMQDPDDENIYITKHGKLTFVDLAGSEKVKNEGQTSAGHLQESNNINKSLLVLGNCISALGDAKRKQGHIPYRDSKLTKLLADSLGGNGVTLMIACVSPSSFNGTESLNTLRYANRAKKIKTKPVVRMDPREKLIMSLKREIKVLRQENHYLRQQLEFPVKPRGQLQKENDEKFMKLLKEQQQNGQKNISDHGLYEMLQEYMIENETLRTENSDLHQVRDETRREQQMLARENEKLIHKLEILEKERSLIQTPVSAYSIGSSLTSRRSSYDTYEHTPQGTPPHWGPGPPPPPPHGGYYSRDSSQASWNGHGNGHPRRQDYGGVADTRRGSNNDRSHAGGAAPSRHTPPSHLQHPMKPPHRLSEPVAKYNQGYSDSPRGQNSYTNRYHQEKHYYRDTGPPPQGHGGYQRSQPPAQHPGDYTSRKSQGQYQGNHPHPHHHRQANGSHHGPNQDPPVPTPRRSKGRGMPGQYANSSSGSMSIPSDNGSGTLSTTGSMSESVQEMNERLRYELLELEGQIKNQTRLSQNGPVRQMDGRR